MQRQLSERAKTLIDLLISGGHLMLKFIAECTCGNKKALTWKTELTVRSALELVDRLVCSECRQPVAYLFDNRDRMIYDVVSSSRCSSCDEFIPLPRLKYVLGTSLCTECATSGENDLKRPPPHPNPPANLASCPRCANPTQMRQNGAEKSWFVGCSTYPQCRWTKNVE